MVEYLNHVKFIVNSVSAIGNEVKDEDLVLYALNDLSSECESFITIAFKTSFLPLLRFLICFLLKKRKLSHL